MPQFFLSPESLTDKNFHLTGPEAFQAAVDRAIALAPDNPRVKDYREWRDEDAQAVASSTAEYATRNAVATEKRATQAVLDAAIHATERAWTATAVARGTPRPGAVATPAETPVGGAPEAAPSDRTSGGGILPWFLGAVVALLVAGALIVGWSHRLR